MRAILYNQSGITAGHTDLALPPVPWKAVLVPRDLCYPHGVLVVAYDADAVFDKVVVDQ
jgi:hypothetical protein